VEIKNRVDIDNNFDFQNITAERVEKIINTINIKKSYCTFFRKERFNSCPKITSFGTSRAAFQKIIFHGFLFQFSNQISLLPKFLPCFSIAMLIFLTQN
jgi:hypothetical protein